MLWYIISTVFMINIKPKLIFTRCLFASAFLFLLCSITYAQEPMQVVKIPGGINFDGVPDEEVWSQIPPIEMIMHMPVYGKEPSEASSIKIAYDDKYLYVSGVLSQKDPSTIRAVSKKRDYASTSTDWFGIILDTYNDSENAVGFFTNPNGIRTDGTSRNDASERDRHSKGYGGQSA